MNINKLNEIDKYYNLIIRAKRSFKYYNFNDIFLITTFIRRGENQIIFYDCMRNEWIFGNKQLLNFINDIYVKYYKFIHYKDYDEIQVCYSVNVNEDIDYIATATLTKKQLIKKKIKSMNYPLPTI